MTSSHFKVTTIWFYGKKDSILEEVTNYLKFIQNWINKPKGKTKQELSP